MSGKITEILTLLVSPRELSFINKSERDLFKIAKKINKDNDCQWFFKGKGRSMHKC